MAAPQSGRKNIRDRTGGSRAGTTADRKVNYYALKDRWHKTVAAFDEVADLATSTPDEKVAKLEVMAKAMVQIAGVYKIMHPATAPDADEPRRAVGEKPKNVTDIKSWTRKR